MDKQTKAAINGLANSMHLMGVLLLETLVVTNVISKEAVLLALDGTIQEVESDPEYAAAAAILRTIADDIRSDDEPPPGRPKLQIVK